MKKKGSRISHCLIMALAAIAGLILLVKVMRAPDSFAPGVGLFFWIYGILLLIGSALYYFTPRYGSAILTATLLSTLAVMPMLQFPGWVGEPVGIRLTWIIAMLSSAALVSPPLLKLKLARKA